MTVAELEELLAMLPADMGVCIRMSRLACRHITRVDKVPSRRVNREMSQAFDHALSGTTVSVSDRHPPMLVLEAGMSAPMWCHAFPCDVDYTVAGRWPDKPARRRKP
jgi:hypothetical protein